MHTPLFLFPPIPWFAQIKNNNAVTFQLNEHFVKQTFRNRYAILTANGVQHLSVHLAKRSSKTITRDIQIDYSENWPLLHYKSLKAAYNNSPYFVYYETQVTELLNKKPKFLFDLNLLALEFCNKTLQLNFLIEMASSFYTTNNYLFWSVKNLNNKLQSQLTKPYYQVFDDRFGFTPNLSILDLIFNLGPESATYLKQLKMEANNNDTTKQ